MRAVSREGAKFFRRDMDRPSMSEVLEPVAGLPTDTQGRQLACQDIRTYRIVCRFDIQANRNYMIILDPSFKNVVGEGTERNSTISSLIGKKPK